MSLTIGPELPGFEIEKILSDNHTIIIHARSIRSRAICPECNSISTRVHSTYLRCPADLPCCGKSIRLRLQVRRFFCPNEACHRKTHFRQVRKWVST
ncbi:MAG: transposase family protein [Anaerolineae bacterium]|nr:transposase family protein [Anaerolineae bacterium]